MSYDAIVMFALFIGAGAIGVPIGFAMIATGLVYLLLIGGDIGLVAAPWSSPCRPLSSCPTWCCFFRDTPAEPSENSCAVIFLSADMAATPSR